MDNIITENSSKNIENNTVLNKNNKIENSAFWTLLVTIAIAPIVFTTYTFSPIDLIKYNIISYGVLISGILFLISVFKTKNISIPKHNISLGVAMIVVSIFISTFLSPNIIKSFFGQGFEANTASFILIIIFSAFLLYNFVKNNSERVLYIYSGLLFSAIVLFLFQISRMIMGADFIDFGVFPLLTSTPIGKWNDLGIFSSIFILISYFGLKLLNLNKIFKGIFIIIFAISSLTIFIVNSSIILGILSLIFLLISIYEFSIKKSIKNGISGFYGKLSILPIIIFIVLSVLTVKGDAVFGKIINKLDIVNTEAYLPWQYTIDIASNTIKESPIFGAGANRFVNQYLKYKPQEINQTQFFGVEFANGFGNIPSIIVTQGLLGIILWIFFIIVFSINGYKNLNRNETENEYLSFLKSSLYFISLSLILANIIYTPSHVIMLFTAIFIGLSFSTISVKEYSLNKKLISALLILIIIIEILWFSALIRKSIAVHYFESGIQAINAEDKLGFENAEKYFTKSIQFDKSDVYYQALSENSILKISSLSKELQKQSQ
ncbi:MAG: hypothetical protein AAB683_00190, partial [Patescibacteria group bacterium]